MDELKVLGDFIKCDKCGSSNSCYSDTDEFELYEYDNVGHANIDYCCKDCGNRFRVCIEFTYNVTNGYVR